MAAALPLVVLIAVPIAALFVGPSEARTLATVTSPELLSALGVSVVSATCATVLVVLSGTPLAWWLSRRRTGWRQAARAVVLLPVVLPPAAAGLALLLAFGRNGVAAPLLEMLGIRIAFTPLAVVFAQVFVSAPFYVYAAHQAFSALDWQMVGVARTLGCSTRQAFVRVVIPMVRPALVAGTALTWARALGEFGATLLFAGNLPGRTQTLPLALYDGLDSGVAEARVVALVIVAVALAVTGLGAFAGARNT